MRGITLYLFYGKNSDSITIYDISAACRSELQPEARCISVPAKTNVVPSYSMIIFKLFVTVELPSFYSMTHISQCIMAVLTIVISKSADIFCLCFVYHVQHARAITLDYYSLQKFCKISSLPNRTHTNIINRQLKVKCHILIHE